MQDRDALDGLRWQRRSLLCYVTRQWAHSLRHIYGNHTAKDVRALIVQVRLVWNRLSLSVLLGNAERVSLRFGERIQVRNAIGLQVDQRRVLFRRNGLHGCGVGQQVGVNLAVVAVVAPAESA